MFKQSICIAVAFGSLTAGALEKPWHDGKKLSDKALIGNAKVCTDGKGHYAARIPVSISDNAEHIYSGDGKKLVVARDVPVLAGGGVFFDPRYYNPKGNADFRGMDFRNFGFFQYDETKMTCEVTCGTRTVPLTLLDKEKARDVLLAAAVEANPQEFEPVTLLRDSNSHYYLVERSLLPGGEKNFRLWVGPKGSMLKQKLLNTVTDSEGQIFSTHDGELRLLLDNVQPSYWIENKKKLELRSIPLGPNYTLIYNELGVYRGVRLGTPCDDL